MQTPIQLEKFQGPLDLLLQLIESEELPLSEIALSEVTDQFVQYLHSLEEENPTELADFLVVATKLLYLKSRLLLPYLYPPDEEDGPTLAEQLKLYKQYVEASKQIIVLWNRGEMAYGRLEPPVKMEGFFLPSNAGSTNLEKTLRQLLKRLKPLDPLPQVAIDRTLSVKQRIENIYTALRELKKLTFRSLLDESSSRSEVIVTFLAILELVKTQRVHIDQKICFEEVEVRLV